MNEERARPVRKDSARNRARLVDAAREVFAERGFGATLDDIARHAGVGTGTAYRHFPNKQAIAAEVLAEATGAIAQDARDVLEIEDSWLALVTFCERTATRQAADRGLYETLTGQGNQDEQAKIWPRVVASVSELFDRARAAGAIRPDAAAQDIAAIFAMLGPAFEMSRAITPDLWRRYLALLLDGLRPAGQPQLPVPPPPVEQLDAVLFAGKRGA
ncbi:TetR family transcriptional regulator [Promicromonospora sp. AC04]|uniref:TetR/AcrR family transcriptional regulator n=1 Tax=Promicromonospora sp. AC04 TaxID=2135723 RepID=UPI000D38E1B8|nr:TetR/AcrR family transcriptional regulator [Promicromonospora sp. AC04]PUB20278.1 TetR family transcriptional regulator [Promicromonospora sp. AC04]